MLDTFQPSAVFTTTWFIRKRVGCAAQKNIAALLAYDLLRQFNQKISITKGSAFCKLTALLYGEPRANLQYTCRRLLEDKKLRS